MTDTVPALREFKPILDLCVASSITESVSGLADIWSIFGNFLAFCYTVEYCCFLPLSLFRVSTIALVAPSKVPEGAEGLITDDLEDSTMAILSLLSINSDCMFILELRGLLGPSVI